MGARWKREQVQDHKFDFINVDDFIDNSCWRQFCYCMVFVIVIRGILVYCADIFTAVNLLANKNPDTFFHIDEKTGTVIEVANIKLPFIVYKYLFSACIILGLLLLAWDIRRAIRIIKTRDIAFAFTSMIANRYYVIRSYPHYCLFSQINNSKKRVDELAFFCFFTFRGWKRLMLADAPRQVINASILVQTFLVAKENAEKKNQTFNPFHLEAMAGPSIMKQITMCLMAFTVLMFASQLIQFLAACIIYLPLLSHIQGNLKEFCCHKIDKRIDELIRKNTKKRALEASQGRSGNTKDIALGPMKQPTLPQVDLSEPAPKPKRAETFNKPSNAHYNPGPRTANKYQDYNNNNSNNNYGNTYNNAYGNKYNQGGGYGNTGGGDGYGYGANQSNHPYYQQQQQQQQYQQSQKPAGKNTTSSATKAIDPYADSAYTTPDDIYDAYNSNYEQQYLTQQNKNDQYSSPLSPLSPDTTYYEGGSKTTTPSGPPRPQRYNTDYSQTTQQSGYPFPHHQQTQQHQPRPGSPLQSQHGSELDGSHHSSGHGGGYNNYNHSNNAYGGAGYYGNQYSNTGGNGGGYGGHQPQRPRRQDTGHSRY
ncbi:hypothetical protein BGZ73_003746 [Actinomortierella ambigua]|nr:hypothetical protein BGZ73_003746 [Actinomortierella ambigua]